MTIHGTTLIEWTEGGGLFASGVGGAEAAGGGAHGSVLGFGLCCVLL